MERNKILERIETICRAVLEDAELNITESTSAAEVEGWDSLVNIAIMSEIETAFNIEFSLEDMQNSKNMKHLVDVVSAHLTKI